MKMSKLKLNYCCFCGDLRTGSLITGYITLIRDVLVVLTSIIVLSLASSAYGSSMDRILIPVFGILLVTAVFNAIMDVVLIIGIHQYKVAYLKTYFFFNIIEIVLASPTVLALCITSKLHALIPLCLIFLALHVYYSLVIRSYYLKMNDPSKKAAIYEVDNSPIPAEYIVHFKQEELLS